MSGRFRIPISSSQLKDVPLGCHIGVMNFSSGGKSGYS